MAAAIILFPLAVGAAQAQAPGGQQENAGPETGGADTAQPAPVSATGDSDSAAPDSEPLSEEQRSRDEEIRSSLQALFDRITSLRGVDVEVEAGIVRLEGRALSLEARQRALELAEETDGVVFVEDRVRVVTDLRQRLEPALDRIQDYAVGAVAFLPLLVVAVGLFAGFMVVGGWAARWEGPHLRFARTPFTRGLIKQLIRLGFGLAGLLVALELLDATALVGAVLGAAGVFGLALGFAFKDIVENHLAGIMLSLRQPFSPNDHIVVGPHEGKVVRLTARETILMTLSGNHVRIPNAELYRSVMTNYTRNPRRRFDFQVSVGTADDLLAAQDAGLQALAAMKGVMEDPAPSVRVMGLGDSWVTLQFFGWVDQTEADFGRVRSEAIRLVKRALEGAEITMPSPEYAVVMRGFGEAEEEGEAPARAALEGPPRRPAERGVEAPARELGARELGGSADQQDVSVDHTLDEQIAEDRRTSSEEDLLSEESELGGEGDEAPGGGAERDDTGGV